VWGLRCAEIAAKAIEYAFDANRYGAFFWKTEYERRRQAAIGKDLKRQLAVRNLYGRLSNEQISKIFEIIKPSLKHMGAFDCDALSGLVKKLPKFSVARTIVPALLRLS
jgi:flavin-dependent dehydrogenase